MSAVGWHRPSTFEYGGSVYFPYISNEGLSQEVYVVGFIGVPYRIRTGVAAVREREGKEACFHSLVGETGNPAASGR
jgi:hypothetical protein